MSKLNSLVTRIDSQRPRNLVLTLLLLVGMTTSAQKLLAADEPVVATRRIKLQCDCFENQPVQTEITRLIDHNLMLTNFRAVGDLSEHAFTVDKVSGSVRINRADLIDFEARHEFRLLVLADEPNREPDEFLADFSAGLKDEGLSDAAWNSVSITTVQFEITLHVHDVQESPMLLDSDLLVRIHDSSPVEFGAVTVVDQSSSDAQHYYITSGNEDDVFRIDPATGVLTLQTFDSTALDLITPFELEILAENSAGQSATACVSVTVYNEAPPLTSAWVDDVPELTILTSTTSVAEAQTEPGGNEPELNTADVAESSETSVPDQMDEKTAVDRHVADILPGSEKTEFAEPVQLTGQDTEFLPETGIESGHLASAETGSVVDHKSSGAFLTFTGFALFLIASVSAAVISSRARARVKALANLLEAERIQSAMNAKERAEEIQLLQKQLAVSHQLILQLKEELDSKTYDSDPGDSSEDLQIEASESSWNNDNTPPYQNAADEPELEALSRSTSAATAILDDAQHLRHELADLFEMQPIDAAGTQPEEPEMSLESPVVTYQPETVEAPTATVNAESVEKDSEDAHLDSVKSYLARLLERSQDATSPESILVDRRKKSESPQAVDRRQTPDPPRKAPVSFLDGYMSAYGGELQESLKTNGTPASAADQETPPQPTKPRAPVDVHSIRESMNSFRTVAIQSFENAVVSHVVRQARIRIAWRTALIAVLITFALLIYLANTNRLIEFSMLNWLMSASVIAALAELCVRIQAGIKQRKIIASAISAPRPADRRIPSTPNENSVIK